MSTSKPPDESPERAGGGPPADPMIPRPTQPSSELPKIQWPESERDAKPLPQEKPREIKIAVILMYVGAALQALAIVLLNTTQARDQMRRDAMRVVSRRDGGTAEQAQELANSVFTGLMIACVIAVALWILMAVMNSQGRSWARLTATVLALLNVLAAFSGLFPTGLLSVVVGIAAVVLLWLPKARPWYERGRPLSV
ncbi:MAG TPA: hypothetical protein VIL34_10060 [Actinopolymorphaceae bacterium]|jgi:hypothetical protein